MERQRRGLFCGCPTAITGSVFVFGKPTLSYRDEAALIHDLDKPKAPPRVVPLPTASVKSANEVVGALPDGRILMVKVPRLIRRNPPPQQRK